MILISFLIRLMALGVVGYGLYRLIRASRNNPALKIGLMILGLIIVVTLIIGYAYLGALGHGMSL